MSRYILTSCGGSRGVAPLVEIGGGPYAARCDPAPEIGGRKPPEIPPAGDWPVRIRTEGAAWSAQAPISRVPGTDVRRRRPAGAEGVFGAF